MAILNIDKLRTQRTTRPHLHLTQRTKTWWQKNHTPTHVWASFACINIAAFTTLPQLGWLTTGIGLLVIDALRGDDS